MRNKPELAPAKVNLTLHITGQRYDGYHLLDSLVVFADVGDLVYANPADDLTLTVTGPAADGVPTDGSNLVLKAAKLLGDRGAQIALNKVLPSGGGIGGGSSDAAATLRLLSRLWNVPVPMGLATLGADIPVCMTPQTQRMSGIGDVLKPGPNLPPLPAVLVNPGVHVSTPTVFKHLVQKQNAPMPDIIPDCETIAEALDFLKTCRNDLVMPAVETAPQISNVLKDIETSGALFHQMSGSGSTCFGIYETAADAQKAADQLRRLGKPWWITSCTLNP